MFFRRDPQHFDGGRADGCATTTEQKQRFIVLGLCFATIVFDGYDLIVYGSVVPALLDYGPWGLTPQRVGNIASLGLVGMLFGALGVGALTDRIGRRKVLLGCLVWFSLAMGACALAPSAGLFAAARFLAGLGLGGVMPTTVALTVEYAPADRHHRYNAVMFSGYSVGGVLAALLAIWFLPDYGFRLLFGLGMLPLITVVPLAWRFLPESRQFKAAKKQPLYCSAVHRAQAGGHRAIPAGQFLRPPAGVRAQHLAAQDHAEGRLPADVVAGLPGHAQRRGGHRGALRLGGGRPSRGQAGDRGGFVVAACAVLLMSRGLSIGTLYVVVAAAGLGSVGTQILLNGYVASYYGADHRASALGWTLGVGRLGAILGPTVGGWLLASSLGVDWNFYTFAVAATAGAVLVACVPRLDRRLTFGSPATNHRQGESSPLPGLRPMRTELPGSAGGGVPSSRRTTGPVDRSVPSRSPVRPSA